MGETHQGSAGGMCRAIRPPMDGEPYRSKQVEIARLTAENGIGVQQLDIFDFMRPAKVDSCQLVDLRDLANNDGLSFSDWYHWFRLADVIKPMAIIHFTKFRY